MGDSRPIVDGRVGGRVPPSGRTPRYYEALGRGADFLLRCKDCRKLVTAEVLAQLGSCPCGNRKVVEITTLNEEEMGKIVSGEIDFPYRDEFLAEFTVVTGAASA